MIVRHIPSYLFKFMLLFYIVNLLLNGFASSYNTPDIYVAEQAFILCYPC